MTLAQLIAKRNSLLGDIDNAKTEEELNKINLDLRKVDMQFKEEKRRLEEEAESSKPEAPESARTAAVTQEPSAQPVQRMFNPEQVAARSNSVNLSNQGEGDNTEDLFSSIGYRKAFMDYVLRGTPIPQQYVQARKEQRADQMTVVSDVSALIPTNLMNRIIEEAQSYGMILPRVTQTSFKGGVEIPVADIFPTATWITEETPSGDQKATANAKVTFSYYMLECRVSLGLLTETVTLPIFENTIVNNTKIAMVKALETAIVKGTGSGQPKGFTAETIETDQVVTLEKSEVDTVKGWAKVEAAMPLAYENGSYYIMHKSTWEQYINGAVDTNGQKLGFANIQGKLTRVLNGREVILTEYLPSFDKAATGDIFCVLINLSQYLLNSNLAMTYKRYFDEDKNKFVHKSLMIADGKIADKNGIVFVKKGDTV